MRHLLALSLLASLAVLTACGKVRESPAAPTPEKPVVPIGDPGGGPGGPTAPIAVAQCTACHGTPDLQMADADPLVAVAPPRSLASMTDPGAHRAHLVNGRYRKAVECASCHLVPTTPPP
ncbi:MAG TPA: hypothetical protein VFK90_17860, partial [Anaeromyxobacter sp.]|nr:hypothetical protein [Anaeromyxobacter sp.]